MNRFDYAVVGAGILGLAVARELRARHPRASIVVLEREGRLAAHQSSHNSGVIHAGVYYLPGSLKARLCVEGARRMYAYCEERGIAARDTGKLIIAATPAELPALEELDRRARANGVSGLRRLDGEAIAAIEPHARGVAALHSPRTGVVDYGAVCRSLAAELAEQGVEIRLDARVEAFVATTRGLALDVRGAGAVEAGFAFGCAGLFSDRLAVAAGAPEDPRIIPFRGGYLRLRTERAHLVRSMIYPVPDPALPFLGVHFTRSLAGEVLIGPTALLVASRTAYRAGHVDPRDLRDTLLWPGTWRMAARWWRTGLSEIRHALRPAAFARLAARYVPELGPDDVETAWGGVRAQAVGRDGRLLDDFAVSRTERALHVRNAPSPAATSAFALAAHVVDAVR